MPNIKSVIKDIRQNNKRRIANREKRAKYRTLIKRVKLAKTVDEAKEAFRAAEPYLDKMARVHIIHHNKAARIKSRLLKHIDTLKSSG